MNEKEYANWIYFFINGFVFIAYSLLAAISLIKIKFRLDRASIASIIIMVVCFTVRFFTFTANVIAGNDHWMKLFILPEAVTSFLELFITYYFVFEMKIVQDKLKSNSYQECTRREKRTIKTRNIFLVLVTIIFTAQFLILIKIYFWDDTEEGFNTPTMISYIVIRTIRLLADCYIFIVSVAYFVYIVKSKEMHLHDQGQQMSTQAKAFIGWTFFVLLLSLVDIISIFIVGIVEPVFFEEDSITYFLIDFQKFGWMPIRDFLTMITMLYLFYYQATVQIRESRDFHDKAEDFDSLIMQEDLNRTTHSNEESQIKLQLDQNINRKGRPNSDQQQQENEYKIWNDSYDGETYFRTFLMSQFKDSQASTKQ